MLLASSRQKCGVGRYVWAGEPAPRRGWGTGLWRWDGSRLKEWGGYIMYPPQTVKVDSPHILSYLYRFIELKLQNSLIMLPHKHRSVRLLGIGVVNTGA